MLLDQLSSYEIWMEFLHRKSVANQMRESDILDWENYIRDRSYLPLATSLDQGARVLTPPEKKELNRLATDKKRVVYVYPDDEKRLLKVLAHLLYRYDDRLPSNCYAFRRKTGVRQALGRIVSCEDLSELSGYKADIHNYFNSIDTERLSRMLEEIVNDDPPLLSFLQELVLDKRVYSGGELVHEDCGVKAGSPVSSFFANICLLALDRHFQEAGILYARYSDDIILFDQAGKLDGYISFIREFLEGHGLAVNRDKEMVIPPGGAFTYLGFRYDGGELDIAPESVRKLMGRIRRSARSLRRWSEGKKISPDILLYLFNRKFNRRFYGYQEHSLCWSRWYFPLLTTDRSLLRIDSYMQDYQRYLVTGRHNKANRARVPYSLMKEAGYRPLVPAYYKSREEFSSR